MSRGKLTDFNLQVLQAHLRIMRANGAEAAVVTLDELESLLGSAKVLRTCADAEALQTIHDALLNYGSEYDDSGAYEQFKLLRALLEGST